MKECTPKIACNKEITHEFKIDLDSQYSLNNWMTQFDLICEESYKIGFLGLASFLGFAMGSIFFNDLIDT